MKGGRGACLIELAIKSHRRAQPAGLADQGVINATWLAHEPSKLAISALTSLQKGVGISSTLRPARSERTRVCDADGEEETTSPREGKAWVGTREREALKMGKREKVRGNVRSTDTTRRRST